ncbi:MAG: hypothetical protein Satyrvirus7_13 [Satyrvirus sp.]|uniref:Uncharacterized protein n=1 Tax=Satyrvirus sp. TaxID=2487771 RepID=A0A3G5AII0_9VIRU|nr:MAG: hypothetical protein Satyrvirus7_13 [Satyrvirus sp.]
MNFLLEYKCDKCSCDLLSKYSANSTPKNNTYAIFRNNGKRFSMDMFQYELTNDNDNDNDTSPYKKLCSKCLKDYKYRPYKPNICCVCGQNFIRISKNQSYNCASEIVENGYIRSHYGSKYDCYTYKICSIDLAQGSVICDKCIDSLIKSNKIKPAMQD